MNFIEQEIQQVMDKVKRLTSDTTQHPDKRVANKVHSRLEDALWAAQHIFKPSKPVQNDLPGAGSFSSVKAPPVSPETATACICPPGAIDNECRLHGF